LIVVGCLCVVFGGVATYFFNRLLNPQRRVKLLGTLGAAFLVSLVLAATPLPGWAKILCIIVGGLLGFFLIKGREDIIICVATAFIGSVLFFHGIGSFAGGFPPLAINGLKNTPVDAVFIAYLAGIIIMSVVGAKI